MEAAGEVQTVSTLMGRDGVVFALETIGRDGAEATRVRREGLTESPEGRSSE